MKKIVGMASEEKDPYAVLGVSRTATQEEIRNAYRALAKRYHPDLNPGKKEAEARFKDIGIAYEKIGTAEARAKFERGEAEAADAEARFRSRRGPYYYQTEGAASGGRYTHSFGEGFDDDLFANLFREARGPRGPAKGEDRLYRMEIDLRDAVAGAEKEISLPNGKRLAVKVPPGVGDGSRLRFAGQGEAGREGGPAGDAYVEIRVRPDPRFRREGDDLVLDLPLPLADAVLGGEVRVPTVEGAVRMKIPPGTSSGRRFRVPGKGVPVGGSGKRGDLYVVPEIQLPDPPDPALREAIERWSRGRPDANRAEGNA